MINKPSEYLEKFLMKDNSYDISPLCESDIELTVQKLFHNKLFNICFSLGVMRCYHQSIGDLLNNPFKNSSILFNTIKPIKNEFLKSKTFDDVLNATKKIVLPLIGNTTTNVTYTGLENLTNNDSYLFISNHRDIFMDAAIENMILDSKKIKTSHIAIGSNLMNYPFFEEFSKLLKGFIVKRESHNSKRFLNNMKELSEVIYEIRMTHNNLWIANREGRSKDGNDECDSTVIHMLNMASNNKTITSAELLNKYNIVPVSISYEYDPCDKLKSWELYIKNKNKSYCKKPWEDLLNIYLGVYGFKGRVQVGFGKPIKIKDSFNKKEIINFVKQNVDNQIFENYKLWPSNKLCDHLLDLKNPKGEEFKRIISKDKIIKKKYYGLKEECRPFFLNMYAKPVFNKLK